MSKIINGREIAKKREANLKEQIVKLASPIAVVSILVGDDPASLMYTNLKKKKAEEIGIDFRIKRFEENAHFGDVLNTILDLNEDKKISGIMIQLPLPKIFLDRCLPSELTELIDPKKDIDGLTEKRLVPPAVAKAVLIILEEEKIECKNKKVAVMGAKGSVGKEIVVELKELGAEVFAIDVETENPAELTKQAEIIISAVGKPGVLSGEMVSEGAIVIDVGTLVIKNEDQDKVVGDVDFESVAPKASKITPVPGGVGPVTIVALMENILYLNSLG